MLEMVSCLSQPTLYVFFTIPGKNLGDAKVFADAMCQLVCWIYQNLTQAPLDNNSNTESETDSKATKKTGCPQEYWFKLDYKCPRSGRLKHKAGSQKTHPSRKCGCLASFGLIHHMSTNTLQVVWHWDHNHQPASIEEMQSIWLPQCIENWLDQQVLLGASWKEIQKRAQCPNILSVSLFTNLCHPNF